MANILFHLMGQGEWEAAQRAGTYEPESLKKEGFIHLSTHHQLLGTFKKWFAGREDLVCLCIAADKLKSEVRFDPVGDDKFPHLYGPLNLDAVHGAAPLKLGKDGDLEISMAALLGAGPRPV